MLFVKEGSFIEPINSGLVIFLSVRLFLSGFASIAQRTDILQDLAVMILLLRGEMKA